MKLIRISIVIYLLTFIQQTGFTQTKQAPIPAALESTSVPGDPLKAKMYILKNGIHVYLSVYKDEPRFQSMIGVKAGSKTDPSDATGLAHYLEHMLFKGTDKMGSRDYQKEKPLLDSIFNLYDMYGKTTDSMERIHIYDQIDAVSGEAAKYAIPNEFDKLMSAMGVEGTNAFTSVEQTVYVNDVPSNYAEEFLDVSAERFRKPVMRLFHTELEAVYEEKNRTLDNDGRKVYEAMMAGLFVNHPYGTQTTIGTIDHLKNPSLKKIQDYLITYYVPNNMVMAFSGDFNPDEFIKIIDRKFGDAKPKAVPPFTFQPEKLIKQPIVKEVYGPDAESVNMAFRFGGASTHDADMLTLVDMILSNGQAGMLDLNLNQAQKVLSSSSSTNIMKDYSMHILSGRAREGQTLEEVRDLILKQIAEMKEGNFSDDLLPAIINQLKVEQAKSFETNQGRASFMLSAELDGVDYKDAVNQINRLSKISKQEIIEFVRTWYGDNYVIVYKRTGEDTSVAKVAKPHITPVATNRDEQSDYLKRIMAMKVKPVQPVFIDFNKSISKITLTSGVEVSYVQNKENNLFSLYYILDMGSNNNKQLAHAVEYLEYIGSEKFSAAKLKEEFYKLGCDYGISKGEDMCYIYLTGLHENFGAAVALFEDFLATPKPDDTALANYVDDVLKRRADAKLNKRAILSLMQQYAKYGAKNPSTNILSEQELHDLQAIQLTTLIKNLIGYQHRISYYGPAPIAELGSILNKFHHTPKGFLAIPPPAKFDELKSDVNRVFVFNYDMKQVEIVMMSKADLFNKDISGQVSLYNEYFGGGMSSIVFQTLRESRALAYSVNSGYREPQDRYKSYFNYAYIGSQSDKLPEAMAGLNELLNDMPLSETGFTEAKASLVKSMQTERITKADILFLRDRYKKLGYDYDRRKDIYDKIQTLSLGDIKSFHDSYIKNRNYTTMVLGKHENINFDALSKYGEVNEMGLENLFGY
ncbi:MAG: insulinase family protein [Bacteroidota bacterium]